MKRSKPQSSLRFLELKIPPLAVLALAGGLAWILNALFPQAEFPLSPTTRNTLALLVALVGAVLNLHTAWIFRQHRTTILPHDPARASTLLTTGAFAYSRNPIYLALALWLLAGLLWLGHLPGLLALPAFIAYLDKFQIRPEERALEENFGDSYRRYRARVRRWI